MRINIHDRFEFKVKIRDKRVFIMIVQKEVTNLEHAKALKNIDEKELLLALQPYLQKIKPKLLKVGMHKQFKLFKAVKMNGEGISASEMVVRDRE